ncbi:glycosyltransferase [Lutimonas sp.]|uniref:glycosyltransferase n=1 Tax=Lutimonas sp. TaxID=1872403 RepID=UPI003D9B0B76
MNRIVISVTNDLVTDQRVIKTCECFNELGFEILLIGRKWKSSPEANFPFKTYRFRLFFNHGFLFYAEYNLRLFFKLLFLKKQILYANDLDTLLPNYLVSKISTCKLIYDSHEYFTEVPELISRPRVKWFWSQIEEKIFPKLKNVITVSPKIAEIYTSKYQVPVTVVRNVPKKYRSKTDPSFNLRKKDHHIIVYQGALNMGRGLELMIKTMPLLKDCLLIIVGQGDIGAALKDQVKHLHLQEQVIFLGRIVPDELIGITRQADVGISLEENLGLSYRYCLPNKVFDYIQAEIPVLVSDLPLLKKLVKDFEIGKTLTSRNPEFMAQQIKELIKNKTFYKTGLKKASEIYTWDKEKKVLIDFITNIE